MACFDIDGNIIATQNNITQIADIKALYPLYNDDQLLEMAISIAKTNKSLILWDGEDIKFSGTQTHICKGFSGINFNGSKIIMPDYDGGIIIDIVPDASENITIDASYIYSDHTTNSLLINKIYKVNDTTSGNDGMCLGHRSGIETETILYYSPAIKTSPDGYYETGELYLTPSTGDVECYNVHDYPNMTFELCNGTVVTKQSTNMSTFVRCSRSNTRIHDFVLLNHSSVESFHWGIFKIESCCDIEVDHISGINPLPREISGYFLALLSVSFAHVHDVFVGDSTSWGSTGNRMITNIVYERCHLNRWDCHFVQCGYITIKNCVLALVCYGIGSGTFTVRDCVFKVINATASTPMIEMRGDMPGVYDGNIYVENCDMHELGNMLPQNLVVWLDGSSLKKSDNSKVSGSPDRIRKIENCKLPEQCKSIFKVGVHSDDEEMYKNITCVIEDSEVSCLDSLLIPNVDGQRLKRLIIDKCSLKGQFYITKTLEECYIDVISTIANGESVHIIKNTKGISVINSKLKNVVSDNASNTLIINGSVISGTQVVSNFTNYSLAGNIASDMASVNKHS